MFEICARKRLSYYVSMFNAALKVTSSVEICHENGCPWDEETAGATSMVTSGV